MKNIFVTGINGLLGINLVPLLIENGFSVTGLIRNPNACEGILHPELKLLKGNLDDDYSGFLKETDVFIHIAAETRQSLKKYDDYRKVNVESTKKLIDACVECGVKKFILISTANTSGFGSVHSPGNETLEMKYPFTKSLYAKSKKEAEDDVLFLQDKIDVIVINPAFMIGACDYKPSSGKIILMGLHKKLVFHPPGGKNFVDVRDVCTAIIKSITYGKSGEKYLMVNENLSFRDFFLKLNRITDNSALLVEIPKWVLVMAGFLGDMVRFIGFESSISSANMNILCTENFYSNDKSRKELKVTYHQIDSAINEAVSFFNQQKTQLLNQ